MGVPYQFPLGYPAIAGTLRAKVGGVRRQLPQEFLPRLAAKEEVSTPVQVTPRLGDQRGGLERQLGMTNSAMSATCVVSCVPQSILPG